MTAIETKNILRVPTRTLEDYMAHAHVATDRTSYAFNVPTNLVLNILPTTINREFLSRVRTQAKNFAKKAESSFEITVFKVAKPFVVDVGFGKINVPEGLSIGDGNTRCAYWKTDQTHTPPSVTVKFVNIESAEQYITEYFSYDSTDSTEKTTHKITGAISAFGIDLRTNKGRKGHFGESVRYAYAGDRKDDLFRKIKYFHRELETCDKFVMHVDDKTLRQQTSTLISAFLIAQKLYAEPSEQRQQLISMMKKLSTITANDWQIKRHPANENMQKFDGAQLIMREAINFDYTNQGTGRNDYENTLDFYLYCIDAWMRGKFLKEVYPTHFKGKYYEALDTIAERDFD